MMRCASSGKNAQPFMCTHSLLRPVAPELLVAEPEVRVVFALVCVCERWLVEIDPIHNVVFPALPLRHC